MNVLSKKYTTVRLIQPIRAFILIIRKLMSISKMISVRKCMKPVQTIFQEVSLLTCGIIFVLVLPLLLLVSLPFCVYRFVVHKLIAPCFRPRIGNPVTSMGMVTAIEYLSKNKTKATRCAIVVNLVIKGSVSLENTIQKISDNWISASLPDGRLRYPEFQQYIEKWMGYLFWKQDQSFSLENHVKLHTVAPDADSEQFIRSLMEELMNKPFRPKISPWEVHVVQNYKNGELANPSENLTMLVFALHHALADGYSVMYTLVEGLIGASLQEVQVASPQASAPVKIKKSSFSARLLLRRIMLPYKFLKEAGTYVGIFFRKRTPWHVEDKDKHWRQMYARSHLIPIQKLKDVKNQLNVSFTAALLSCVSAGISRSLNVKMGASSEKVPSRMLMGFNVPLPGHPQKLRNHVTGATYDACTAVNMHPFQRLIITEKKLNAAKYSVFPLLFRHLLTVVACHLAPVVRSILDNTMVPTGMSNFPGPGIQLEWEGLKIVGTDFVSGTHPGVAGVAFMVLSYNNRIRIVAAAEGAVMSREEHRQLINFICEEIDILHDLSEKHKEVLQSENCDLENVMQYIV